MNLAVQPSQGRPFARRIEGYEPGGVMKGIKRIALGSCLLAVMSMLLSGCYVENREGYYDHEHHRYWHEHTWVPCGDADPHCR
jgi:hypothetical protein